jgi:acyl-homoserine-lactone acylase
MSRLACLLAVFVLALTACDRSDPIGRSGADAPPPGGKYTVKITRTALGIPHIKADDFGSLGYGYGYAHAEDNLCVVQEDLVTIRGERTRYYGRDGSYTIVPNGSTASNVDSDFFWKFMATDAAWQKLKASAVPELQAVTQGFADGWNRYIAELRAGGHPGRHLACRDTPWVAPITEADMYRRYYRLALIASSSVFVSGIAQAQPPVTDALPTAPAPTPEELTRMLQADPGELAAFMPENRDRFGSNMYAIGTQGSATGQPLVFGNPHFPWTGTERLYISHLTVPGKLDIMGSSLYGVPAVLIGFNDHFAWSHTVSTAFRFTLYELTLNPLNPTQYLYDGTLRDMEAVPLTIDVLEADGRITQQTRTLYRTHYGPIVGLAVSGVNALPWTPAKAFTLRDANAENDRLINQFAKWNQARSLGEFIELHKTILGIPWVNTVASGPNGRAYYGDVSVVPHVTDAQIQTCQALPLHQVIQQLVPGLPVLDGSRSACEWGSDADAPAPGIFGPDNLPTLQRDDYVHNCNDSYWLTHPDEPIEGYNRIIGAERTARSLRTRQCILQAERRLDGSDGLPGNTFTMQNLQDIVLSSQIYSGELARDDVVASLCAFGSVLTESGPVDVSEACDVLAGWDLRSNNDSVGSHVWREFWRRAIRNPGGAPVGVPVLGPWLTPFSATDPVNTPRDLNVALPNVQQALGNAVLAVEAAGFAMDAPMGSIQHPRFIDTSIPIFGGEGFEGAFTIANSPAGLTAEGYGITYGNSYIQTVTWEPDGSCFKPVAEGFITYSQSTDPASPHYSDFTREYSAKRWKRFPFRPAEIEADTISELQLTE